MAGKSIAIVQFIANLMPLYGGERREGLWCARSMEDGTLVIPVDESEWEEERGTVQVLWQGDPARRSEIDGADIATLAVVKYVELHNVGQSGSHVRQELEGMAEHFGFKTGCSLYLPYPNSSPDLVKWVNQSVGRMGEAALIEALKRLAGI